MIYGTLTLNIDKILDEKDISKNKICKDMQIPRTNFNRYCRNEFQRLDAMLLCKLCYYLESSIADLVTYHPPKDPQ